ncbi:hypothetical protein MN0502_21360 [Arthrobacter sp. MN05-02]|nr:hypothetical protein MN0502_21360 [Arthrobacter sp. MN05-02]
MRPSAWVVTGVLIGLAVVACWFFGLDERHAVVLVGAALAAGVANGLLDAIELPGPTLPALPEQPRGLADLQALEFSLSSADPGTRAALEVSAVAASLAAARPDVPRSRALETFLAQARPATLTHRDIRTLLDELERIAATSPGSRTHARPSAATLPAARHEERP